MSWCKIEKVGAIGAGRRDWDFSAVFPIARGRRWSGAIEKRSARLRTESELLGIAGQCQWVSGQLKLGRSLRDEASN
jgi:hypothetical protein